MVKIKIVELERILNRNEELVNDALKKLCDKGYKIMNVYPQGDSRMVIVYDTLGLKDTVNTVNSFTNKSELAIAAEKLKKCADNCLRR